MLFIGIDSGGTKCAFTLYDSNNEVLSKLVLSTAHPKQVGYLKMREVLQEGVSQLINEYSLFEKDSVGIGFGLAGYSSLRQDAKVIEDIVKEVSGNHSYILVNDVEAAHAASLNCNEGICLVSGTGSIAYGKSQDATFRCGGWGCSIGDEGSGYWIGRRALSAVSKEADGRLPKGSLFNLVMNEYGLKDARELIYLVNETWANKRECIASLAPLVIQAASTDLCAQQIVDDACCELALLVNCVNRNIFSSKQTVPLACVGGIFNAGDYFLNNLSCRVDENIEFVFNDNDLCLGPVLLLKHNIYKEL